MKRGGKKVMKNSTKTMIFTIGLSGLTILIAIFVQLFGQSKVTLVCSYLDPILIDVLAFSAAIFLVVEGIYRIIEHKDAQLKRQFTRSIRIAFGCAIITLHVIQFFYK